MKFGDLIFDHYEGLKELIDSNGADGWKHLAFGSDFYGGIAGIATELRWGGDLPLLTQKMFDRSWKRTNIQLYIEKTSYESGRVS